MNKRRELLMSLTPLLSVLHLSASLLFHHLFPQPSVSRSPSFSSFPVPTPPSLCGCFILSGSQLAAPLPAARLGQAQDCILLVQAPRGSFGWSVGTLWQHRKAEHRGFLFLCIPRERLPGILLEGAAGGEGSGRGLLNQVSNTSCPAFARRYFIVLK